MEVKIVVKNNDFATIKNVVLDHDFVWPDTGLDLTWPTLIIEFVVIGYDLGLVVLNSV